MRPHRFVLSGLPPSHFRLSWTSLPSLPAKPSVSANWKTPSPIPRFSTSPPAPARLLREHTQLKGLLDGWAARQKAQLQRDENVEMSKNETDAEMAAMAAEELTALDAELTRLDREIQLNLLPPDPNEDRDAIVEIRAGTGGSEAALFAADLHRMYTRYVENLGLKIEPMDSSPSELGGLKEAVFRVSGESVFRRLRYESGVHRVQRVPATEAQGRIHTSTATVAVLARGGGSGTRTEARGTADRGLPCGRSRRSGRQHDGFRRAGAPHPNGHHRALPGRPQPDQEQGTRAQHPARPPARTQAGRGGSRLQRAPQEPDRQRRPGGENPHVQFPAKPRHRPPHQRHAL